MLGRVRGLLQPFDFRKCHRGPRKARIMAALQSQPIGTRRHRKSFDRRTGQRQRTCQAALSVVEGHANASERLPHSLGIAQAFARNSTSRTSCGSILFLVLSEPRNIRNDRIAAAMYLLSAVCPAREMRFMWAAVAV